MGATGGDVVAAIAGLVFYFGSASLSAAGYVHSLQDNTTYFDLALNTVLFVTVLQPGVLGLGANIISVIAACTPNNGLPSP